MTKQMTITEVKARLLALVDEVERGEEIEITRRGRPVARLGPTKRARAKMGWLAGVAATADPEDDLLSTGVSWNAQ